MKWTKKLKRSVKELLGGKNTYISKKKRKAMKKEYKKAHGKTRSGLAAAGINWEKDKPSARLMKKGK